MREVFPELVLNTGYLSTSTPDGQLALNYTGIIPPLVKAVQELNLKLEDLATTTPEVSEGSFTSRFFASLFARLTQWFADATNGITDFFARRGIFEEVCVKDANGQTCLTRAQVDALLAGSAAAGTPYSGEASGRTGGSPSDGTEGPPTIAPNNDNAATPAATSTAASSVPEAANDNPLPDMNSIQTGNNDPSNDSGAQAPTTEPSLPTAANDNAPPEELPATGTE